jgi:hypothetical protein
LTDAALTPPRRWLSPQILLGIGGLLTFVFLLIKLNTVYEGLPAHPLLVHVPVILIPTVSVGGLILAAKPAWFERHSAWLCAVTVVALAALNLTMNAGDALRNDLEQRNGRQSDLPARSRRRDPASVPDRLHGRLHRRRRA